MPTAAGVLETGGYSALLAINLTQKISKQAI
jgi:hypothetical protein